jgi:hypothetical protein
MARPGRPERNRAARSFGQLRRFHHVINSIKVFGTHSQRRQYDLVEVARQWGFADVEVIDDDLGRSASGMVARPGFDRLVAWLCAGKVGAVLCFDASRLARNGRDWHHLLELCGLVEARVIDLDGVYNPCRPNDRLLLGMKGQRVRVGRLTRPHAGRRAVQSAPRRAAAIRSLRLYLAPRSRARFGSRPASTGGDPAHLHPLRPACAEKRNLMPSGSGHRGIWVEPSLLAEIEYRAKSAEGKARHPFFKGIREDL